MYMTSTLITVLGLAVLMLIVLTLNPLLRLLFHGRWLRPLSRGELTCVFASMLVTAGIATFGLADQLIPIVGSPWNPDWNTPQSGWNQNVLPHLNPKAYLTLPDDATERDKHAAGQILDAVQADLEPTSPVRAADLTNIRKVLRGINVQRGDLERDFGALDTVAWPHEAEIGRLRSVTYQCFEHNVAADVIRVFRESVPVKQPLGSDGFRPWWQYYKQVFFEIPWLAWAKPLGFWLIFIFGFYGVFYFLSYVVIGYWTRRDKLIFPLAKLPAALIPDPDGSMPRAFRSAGFWIGFSISFLLLSYNALAFANLLPGMTALKLGLNSNYVDAITNQPLLEGLKGGAFSLSFLVIFTAIGIAFLLPTDVSFSIWFYFWIAKVLILAAIWMGYGRTGSDFPSDWLWDSNAITSMGAGGMLLFSAICLWRCLAEYRRLALGKTLRQCIRLFLPVAGLLVCLTIVVFWLRWNRLPLLWSVLFVGFVTMLTLGLMRIVAESGVYWFQVHGASFFHLYKTFGFGALLKPTLVVPLLPIYSVLFLDVKTFMAPNILNAAKMHDEVGSSRLKYHLNLVICIVVTVVFSLGASIYLAHERGANQMSGWFYTAFPKDVVMPKAAQIAKAEPQFQPEDTAWYAVGSGWVGLTLVLRRSLFWFPHPIGYIMLVNPLISKMWFSFFLGWIAKALVVKYGGKVTFERVRLIFIGLIMGELMAVLLWPIMSLLTGTDFGRITLNRYGP